MMRTRRWACVGDVVLVGDDHERQPRVAQLVEQREDRLGVDRVEVARRLVAEQQRGVAQQRPGDRDALLLAARQPRGQEAARGGSCRRGSSAASARSRAALARRRRGRPRRASRSRPPAGGPSRLKVWKTKPIRSRAQRGALVVVERADVDAVEEVRPARRAVQAAEEVQQRRLARARRPDDRQRRRRAASVRSTSRRATTGGSLPKTRPSATSSTAGTLAGRRPRRDRAGVDVELERPRPARRAGGAAHGPPPRRAERPPGAGADDDEVARAQRLAAGGPHLDQPLGREARDDGDELDAPVALAPAPARCRRRRPRRALDRDGEDRAARALDRDRELHRRADERVRPAGGDDDSRSGRGRSSRCPRASRPASGRPRARCRAP